MGIKKEAALALCLLTLAALRPAGRPPSVAAAGGAALPEGENFVALTFDDGPRRSTTERLLDGLRDRDAAATFFLVGQEIAGNEDLIRRMAAEGHQVGNHTWSHVRLERCPDWQQEIRRTEQALERVLGGGGPYWLRPPYGLVSRDTAVQIPVPMVQWSVDPRDWESRNTDSIVRAVLDTVQPGDIILLHDIYPASVDAALEIVDVLSAEGYWFVTVEELLTLSGTQAQPGVLYRRAGV